MTWQLPDPGPLPPGWVRVDCHLHTVHSGDAVTTIEQLAERVAAHRLDVVCVTDHHTLDGAWAALQRGIGARVVVGEEIRTRCGEVIGLFLTERIPYVLGLDEVADRIRAQGGLVSAPHPMDPDRRGLGAPGLCHLHETGLLDVVEVCNAKVRDSAHNTAAAEFAAERGIPVVAGSDAHDPHGVGAAVVQMPDFDGPREFLRRLPRARLAGRFRDHVGWLV
ncbi:PHP domain-containing protein [Saccharopolyspora sp. HNM0983]|uniref:PHP domain-containing protein n=1 Tax=Saccharopolyspora montiporae TaxID=2781240 RepID=A0A929BBM6_9PSEU|nr:PHP domain-containing protein [Saccharopolyspora sp. HNM0983]MBE9375871.1 PHP domain-containing protein [Saccharopolyspora sp. HNM0983]